MNRGYVKIWRKIEDSGLLGNADVCQLFMYLMVKVTHKARKILVGSRVVELEAGQFFTSIRLLAKGLNSTERRVRTALTALQNMEIIDQQATHTGSVLSFVNWDRYQIEQKTSDTPRDKLETQERHTSDTRIYIKQECKNERIRKEKNIQKEKPLKRPYGEFQNVMLTDVERDKLVEAHGKDVTLCGIEVLGGYIEATGKRYKSHYACFRTWVAEKAKEELRKARSPSGMSGSRGSRSMTVAQERAVERDQFAEQVLSALGESDGQDGQDDDATVLEGFEFGLPTSSAFRQRTQDVSTCVVKRLIEIQ